MSNVTVEMGEIAATITDLERELAYYKRLSEAAGEYIMEISPDPDMDLPPSANRARKNYQSIIKEGEK